MSQFPPIASRFVLHNAYGNNIYGANIYGSNVYATIIPYVMPVPTATVVQQTSVQTSAAMVSIPNTVLQRMLYGILLMLTL